MNRLHRIGVALTIFVALNSTAYASIWSDPGWTQFANDEGMAEGPGVGGQFFDAEAFFYRLTGSQLEIGLQTGFEGVKTDGSYLYSDGKTYYSGDLALNINGLNYGVDFGFLTMNYDDDWSSAPNYDPALVDMGSGTGIDPAGIYGSPSWDNGVYKGHGISNPFALNGGTAIAGAQFLAGLRGRVAGQRQATTASSRSTSPHSASTSRRPTST